MATKAVLLVLYVIICDLASGHGICTGKWNHDQNSILGPDHWGDSYHTCAGFHQSPININLSRLIPGGDKNMIEFSNYNEAPFEVNYNLINDGHALQFNFNLNNTYKLIKGNSQYKPVQAHIHFGKVAESYKTGSEHIFNGRASFGEMHIVHKNFLDDTKLLVIGVMVEFTSTQTSSEIMRILQTNAKSLEHPGDYVNVQAFPLSLFLPDGLKLESSAYINYSGSLTTPPCTENVDWVVLKDNLWIDKNSMLALATPTNCDKKPLGGNFRPIQNLNDREVYGIRMHPSPKLEL